MLNNKSMRQLSLMVLVIVSSLPLTLKAQTCGNTNIAVGKPVTVLNQWSFDPASNAVDANSGSFWANDATRPDTNYLFVDLLQSYTVCKVKVNWAGDYPGKNYLIQTSTNTSDWTTIATRTNNTAFVDSFTVIGTGRYVRIYMTAKPVAWADYKISEFEIYNTLSNFHPSVSLTAPVANYKTFAGNNIKLTASASDIDGSISKVEFYQDTIKLGEVTTAPYEFIWTNVQAGQYALRAKAFDNSNADSLSAPVNITVNTSNRWSLTGNTGTNPDSNFVGTTDNKKLVFRTNGTKKMSILPNGFVGIGVDSIPDDSAKLGVNGTIYARKLKINQSSWADYVFEKEYKMMPLADLKAYVAKYKHLPDVPTSSQVQQNGLDVAAMQEILLRKIEELTLYIIEQDEYIREHECRKKRKSKRSKKTSNHQY